MNPREAAAARIARFGVWSTAAASFLSIGFVISAAVAALTTRAAAWTTIEAYAGSFKDIQLLPCVFCFLLVPAVLMSTTAFSSLCAPERKFWARLGLVFSLPYAVIISVNYFLQLFVLRLNLKAGALEGLALLAMNNFHSVFFAFEGIGYHFLCLANLFMAFAFGPEKRVRWLRRLFLFNGLLGTAGLPLVLIDQPVLIFATLGAWSLTFPAAMILLTRWFRQQAGSIQEEE